MVDLERRIELHVFDFDFVVDGFGHGGSLCVWDVGGIANSTVESTGGRRVVDDDDDEQQCSVLGDEKVEG